jgi:hypothetical protein
LRGGWAGGCVLIGGRHEYFYLQYRSIMPKTGWSVKLLILLNYLVVNGFVLVGQTAPADKCEQRSERCCLRDQHNHRIRQIPARMAVTWRLPLPPTSRVRLVRPPRQKSILPGSSRASEVETRAQFPRHASPEWRAERILYRLRRTTPTCRSTVYLSVAFGGHFHRTRAFEQGR